MTHIFNNLYFPIDDLDMVISIVDFQGEFHLAHTNLRLISLTKEITAINLIVSFLCFIPLLHISKGHFDYFPDGKISSFAC